MHNPMHDITGALICRADIYLQMLEGPEEALDTLYGHIKKDDRHVEPRLIIHEPAEDRLFAAWAMRDDPVQSWMWSQEDVADGAPFRADREEILAIFQRLSDDTIA